jgi:hypothetical protein
MRGAGVGVGGGGEDTPQLFDLGMWRRGVVSPIILNHRSSGVAKPALV